MYICIEPVGSVSPKISMSDKSNVLVMNIGKSATFLCPAQSYPVAIFR